MLDERIDRGTAACGADMLPTEQRHPVEIERSGDTYKSCHMIIFISMGTTKMQMQPLQSGLCIYHLLTE